MATLKTEVTCCCLRTTPVQKISKLYIQILFYKPLLYRSFCITLGFQQKYYDNSALKVLLVLFELVKNHKSLCKQLCNSKLTEM